LGSPARTGLAKFPPAKGGNFAIRVRAGDPNGPSDSLSVAVQVFDPDGNFVDLSQATHRGGDLYSIFFQNLPPFESGTWWLVAEATDEAGAVDSLFGSFTVP